MSLSEAIETDASKVFLRTKDFAESVVYLPRCGSPRPINAIVDREPGQVFLNGEFVTPQLIIAVDNRKETGIDQREIDAGDQMLVAIKVKGTPEKRTFKVVQDADEGMLSIAVL